MKINEIKQKFINIIEKQNNLKGRVLDDFTEVSELYVEIFGEYPECYFAGCTPDKDKTIEKLKENFECFCPGSYDYYKTEEDSLVFDKVMYDNNILISDGIVIVERDGITVYTTNTEIRDKVFDSYVSIVIENPCEVYWVSNGQNGFSSTKLTVAKADFDLNLHYNDDFDTDKVEKFVNSSDSGITILHGNPGGGKSYFIRYLAQKYPAKKFYFMHQSTFEYIGTDAFISFLLDNSVKDSVFVLEDCETLLADRVRSGNHMLGTILNLSDGILGDGLHIKFICTFNADLSKIDPALLRKGRLKYKYEFKPLTKEKTQALAKHLGKNIPEDKELSVSEIYNWDEDNNGGQIKTMKKIGF